ncbi:(3S)-malyl-CoA thioesterase [Azospirillaceae bacterium]
MAAPARPRRSVLYVPASNVRAMEKGKTLPADGLILDLEDAVAPDAKVDARKQAAVTIQSGGFGNRELFLRVNGLNTPWGYEDLVAAATSGADAVLLPKVESADVVRQADVILRGAGAPENQALWCMMETPLGMLNAREIASSCPRMGGLVMGTSDLAKDLHARHTRERLPLLTGLGLCLLAARAYRLAILDGVYLDLNDDEGFAYSCRQGVEMGFDGKTLIHPKTIAAANTAFAPSDTEIAQARKIIAAHAAATEAGKGVVVVDGKLVENLHVEDARRQVTLADQIAAMSAAAA